MKEEISKSPTGGRSQVGTWLPKIQPTMWNSALVAATSISLLAPTVHATTGFVQWDISKRSQPKLGLRKRAGTQQEVIDNIQARGGYFATCTLGTPGQHVTLQLDTGSSDIWVPSSSASVCDDNACSLGSCAYHDSSPRPLLPWGP